MKVFRKATLIVAVALIATGAMAQTAKFGHVHSTYVMSKMPEYAKAMKQLTKLDSTYNIELEKLGVEINKKVDEYNKDTISPQIIKESKAEEIQGLQIRAQQFQQRIEQDMQQQQAILFTPVRDKVVSGINAISKEKNLIYVFDISAGNPVYVSDESVNLIPLLMEKFGITYDTNELMQLGL
ncbi:OmpH family outer membrane protein [Bacteroidota bacterium]